MDPHYHIIAAPSEGTYEGLPTTHYAEYASTPNSFARVGGGSEDAVTLFGQLSSHHPPPPHHMHQHQIPPPPTYETVINAGHPVTTPVATYPGYSPTAAQAMEYVQSVYHMQFATQGIGHTFPEEHFGARTMHVTSEGKRKRRRIITHEQRKAANIRERRRMFHLNEAFDQLRKRVPTFAYEKKLSRIETLKLAVTYIQFMGDLVEEIGGEKKMTTSLNDSSASDEGLGTSGDSSGLDLDTSPPGKNNKIKPSSSNINCDIEGDENDKHMLSDEDSDFDDSDLTTN